MGNTRLNGSWSQDPGLVSDEIANIEKGNNWINIITNVILSGGWGFLCAGKYTALNQERLK